MDHHKEFEKATKLKEKGRFRKAAERYEEIGYYFPALECYLEAADLAKATLNLERIAGQSDEWGIAGILDLFGNVGYACEAGRILLQHGATEAFVKALNALGEELGPERPEIPADCVESWLKEVWRSPADSLSKGQFALKCFCEAATSLPRQAAADLIWRNWQDFSETVLATQGEAFDTILDELCHRDCPWSSVFRLFEDGSGELQGMIESISEAVFTGWERSRERNRRCPPSDFVHFLDLKCERPLAAALLCERGLEQMAPCLRPTQETWNDELGWLKLLTDLYLKLGKQQEAVDAYLSRSHSAQAAEILTELGRFEEAAELLELSGAANYRARDWICDTNFYRIDIDQLQVTWQYRLDQAKGKAAVAGKLRNDQRPSRFPQPLSPSELETMFALGEITQEEYDHRKNSLAENGVP